VRLFVGIFPPEDVALHLRERLGHARLTPVERWHVTLAFLGEVDPARRPGIEDALSEVRTPARVVLRLSGGGAFGRGRSTVLWAGVAGDLAALTDLQSGIQQAVGVDDDRPFTPHLTVAYVNNPGVRAALVDYAGPTWTADEFVLVHSRHAEGAGYEILRRWPIG
jgi:RNA 2',3'-cyclic 3'-phosphodiesterase